MAGASLKEIGLEILKRRHNGLAMFRAVSPDMDGLPPTAPNQVAFMKCRAREMLANGGNRSGKTLCAAIRFAALALNRSVFTLDGEEIPMRRPHQKGRGLLMWVIGLQQDHIGQTIYPILFRPGAYKIIKDKQNGLFRAWQPWNPEDVERINETKPAPPLISPSDIDGKIAWDDYANRVFKQVTLKHDGTIIRAYPSSGEVKQGDKVDEIWIDERIKFPRHYPEWQMRTPDVQGNICWSAMTNGDDPAMVKLIECAEEQQREINDGTRETATVVRFQWAFSGNPFILDTEKDRIQESLSEDDLLQRDTGDLDVGASAIYPQFNKRVHTAIVDDPDIEDEVSRILRRNGGKPPASWTHEMILDPGTAKPGVLFCAVPPKNLWYKNCPYFIVYDEIYIRRADAHTLAKEIKKRFVGIIPERFIIDGQAARQKPMGFAKTVGHNYSDVFKTFGIECNQTGPWFIAGDPDFSARSKIVSEWMVVMDNRLPRLRIVTDRCRNLVWQLQHNQLHTESTVYGRMATDKEAKGQRDDIRVCLEYWASRNPTFIPPSQMESGTNVLEQFNDWKSGFFGRNQPDRKSAHFGPGAIQGAV